MPLVYLFLVILTNSFIGLFKFLGISMSFQNPKY